MLFGSIETNRAKKAERSMPAHGHRSNTTKRRLATFSMGMTNDVTNF
jgi:uncharacterized pyridoxal phosphate-containing UPF0001 family protein